MKARSIIFFVSLMICLMLVACTDGSSKTNDGDIAIPDGVTEVVMWNLFGGGDAEFMNQIVEKYNDSQDEYFVNNVLQEFDEYYTKLLTSIGAGRGPDLGIAHSHVLPELVNESLVMNIDEYANDVGLNWDEFNQNILEATIYDGNYFAVPIDTHPEIMYINNDLVKEAGLLNDDGTPDMEETPEGFVKFLTSLKENLGDGKIAFSFSTTGEDPYRNWWAIYNQMGGEHIVSGDLENPDYVLNVELAIEAAKYLYDLYHTHEVIPLNLSDFYSVFQSGDAAVMSTGVWATGIWEGTDDLNFTPLNFPNMYTHNAAWASSHTFILPYYSKADKHVQKGAVDFMKFATDNGAMWAKAGHIPAKDTVVASDEFQKLPYRSEYAGVADYAKFADRTIHARGIQEIVIRNLDRIWSGDASPEETFELIEEEVKDLIGD